MKVTTIETQTDDSQRQWAMENITDDINEKMRQWRILKDHYDAVVGSLNDVKEKISSLEYEIASKLTVPEDGDKSETISVPGAGSVYKMRKVGAKVHDWEAWRKYCVRHNFGAALRQQTNVGPLQDMYDMIMAGELPMPQSVEFTTYEKPSFRRK